MSDDDPTVGPIFVAAVKLLERTGARQFQIRYCDEEQPVVWIAAAQWHRPDLEPGVVWQAAGALSPWYAVLRLLEQAIDGGRCTHCQRPTAVDAGPVDGPLEAVGALVCFYRYDPELSTFRRSCEGKAP